MLEYLLDRLELVKEGNIKIKQDKIFGDIYIYETMNKFKKNNVVKFPLNYTDQEKEIEAILFASSHSFRY